MENIKLEDLYLSKEGSKDMIEFLNKHPQRIPKIKPFIDQYNWKDIDFPSTSKDWRKLELNNEIALNILYVPHNTRKIQVAYKSK